ncbi:EAL domain-containing protein [Consotaella salsifontis]|uniref:Diguanylate cyclase (GGDEF) domain-containing protein n=1 Tax=Consotaella salsifontis TaxID=1365950 RepID=A0A1T4SWG7_9HYPH|nr:EAL domain-containing protein [Consotaella salsifontis]SKA32604.1 diguanylate cyclase (GGDEF) domain-containing protein [Consotaella salsifontis]
MSIRLKLMISGLALTLVAVALGGFAHVLNGRIASSAFLTYDETINAVRELNEAQTLLRQVVSSRTQAKRENVPVDRQAALIQLTSEFGEISQHLRLAAANATSTAAAEQTRRIDEWLNRLLKGRAALGSPELYQELSAIDQEMTGALTTLTAGGAQMRKRVEEETSSLTSRVQIGIAIAVLIGLGITVALLRSIVPPLRSAVDLASAIASGNLQTNVEHHGSGETGELLRTLDTMQKKIAADFGRIETFLAEQETNYSCQLSIQNARFDAALNNMTQGLCMFDTAGRLVIVNRRFAQMFGMPQLGVPLAQVGFTADLRLLLEPNGKQVFSHELTDGRIIEVSRQEMESGGWVATLEDITERRQAENRLAHMARHDVLTGLPNRLLYREYLEQVLGTIEDRQKIAVLSFDLDRFKAVNDTMGHPAGDELLLQVTQRIKSCIRRTDMLARIGGDEFAVIQRARRQPDVARQLAERLIAAFEDPFVIDRHEVSIGLSIGICGARGITHPDPSRAADLLSKNCDVALYQAKREGGNTSRFFEAELDEKVQERRRMELDLRNALHRGEFELFYQPFIDTSAGAIAGFEALLRWRHPQRGFVSPAEFVPIAEEVGLIDSIGAWVLETAATHAAGWPSDLKVAVNLSPLQFRKRTLVDDVAAALERAGLPPERLELEVTESLFLMDTPAVRSALEGFRALGIQISMDDFGTGYSSLSYLRRFPMDKIKIDQSFVRDLEDPGNLAIVRAVMGLSHALNMTVLAEGVETAEQLEMLRQEGCTAVQGYYFSPPRPVSELPTVLFEIAARLEETNAARGEMEARERA